MAIPKQRTFNKCELIFQEVCIVFFLINYICVYDAAAIRSWISSGCLVIHRCHWHSFILPLSWPVGERLISCVSIHSMELLDLYKVTLLQNLISKREKKSIIYEYIPSPWLIVYFLRNCFDVTSKTLIEVCRKLNIFHYTLLMYDYYVSFR